jgi:NADH-ubiquinone oxidoreductase chain 4L
MSVNISYQLIVHMLSTWNVYLHISHCISTFIIYLLYMNLSLILFLIGILGFVLNRKNIILMLISIEIMLLAITFLILIASLNFDDILGQIYATYIISIAGAESAIGLGILVAFYRLRGSIAIEFK